MSMFFCKKKYYRVLELKNKTQVFFELEQARAARVLGTALAADSDSDPCPCNSVLHKSLDVRLTKCYTSTTRNGKLKHTERILNPENSFHIHPVRRRKKIPEFDDGIIFNPSKTGGDIAKKTPCNGGSRPNAWQSRRDARVSAFASKNTEVSNS